MTYRSYKSYVGRVVSPLAGVCVAFALALPATGFANAIIGTPVDWDSNPSVPGVGNWTRLGSEPTTSITEDIGDLNDNFLKITFDSDPALPEGGYETVKGPATDLLVGTWQTDYWIEFDFWANNVLPNTLQIRWADSSTNRVWGNAVTPGAGIGSWSTLRTDTFSNFEDWELPEYSSNEEEFLRDLGSIDWIGVYIDRTGTDLQLYGVDDFKLMVPEPAEYLMLAAALITALLVMRRQKLLPAPLRAA